MEITELHSTDETAVGTWIDGKPVYQKVYDFTAAPIAGGSINEIKQDITDLHVDTLISLDGTGTDGYHWNIAANAEAGVLILNPAKTGITYYGNSKFVLYSVIIKYTKTTDAAGDGTGAGGEQYSTDETVIGTWIDGKPVYRKVYDYSAAPIKGGNLQEIKQDITDLHVKLLINLDGLGNDYYTPYVWNLAVNGGAGVLVLNKDKTGIVYSGGNFFELHHVIIEYTKTTD